MGYYIDLSKISITDFLNRLKNTQLLPSQKILKDNIDEKFKIILESGIKNMDELKTSLNTKKDVTILSEKTGINDNYLTILRREVNSYHPKPRYIKDFKNISQETMNKLDKAKLKTTLQLYDKILTKNDRKKLSSEFGISNEELLLLAKLTDVSRIRYVNPDFAILVINTKFDTTQKIKNAGPKDFFNNIIEVNEEKQYFKGAIRLSDIEMYVVKDAALISLEIEY